MSKLEFVTSKKIISESKTIRPDMFRLDFLELQWLGPESLLKSLNNQIKKGNTTNEEGKRVFDPNKCVADLIAELQGEKKK